MTFESQPCPWELVPANQVFNPNGFTSWDEVFKTWVSKRPSRFKPWELSFLMANASGWRKGRRKGGGHWSWGWLNQSAVTAEKTTLIINVSTVLNFTSITCVRYCCGLTAALSTAESNRFRAFIDPQVEKKHTPKDSKSWILFMSYSCRIIQNHALARCGIANGPAVT